MRLNLTAPKRDSLDRFRSRSPVISMRLFVALTVVGTAPVFAQDTDLDSSARRKAAVGQVDTNIVMSPSWTPLPVNKTLVLVIFRSEATPAERADAVASVRGTVIDTTPPIWLIRVPSHPNACGVLRATERLKLLPSVAIATPDWLIPYCSDRVVVIDSVPTAVPKPEPQPDNEALLAVMSEERKLQDRGAHEMVETPPNGPDFVSSRDGGI